MHRTQRNNSPSPPAGPTLSRGERANLVLRARLDDANLKAMLFVLDQFMGQKDHCWPSVATLAECMCCSERTVQRCMVALRDGGIIDYRDSNTGRASRTFTINYERLIEMHAQDMLDRAGRKTSGQTFDTDEQAAEAANQDRSEPSLRGDYKSPLDGVRGDCPTPGGDSQSPAGVTNSRVRGDCVTPEPTNRTCHFEPGSEPAAGGGGEKFRFAGDVGGLPQDAPARAEEPETKHDSAVGKVVERMRRKQKAIDVLVQEWCIDRIVAARCVTQASADDPAGEDNPLPRVHAVIEHARKKRAGAGFVVNAILERWDLTAKRRAS